MSESIEIKWEPKKATLQYTYMKGYNLPGDLHYSTASKTGPFSYTSFLENLLKLNTVQMDAHMYDF